MAVARGNKPIWAEVYPINDAKLPVSLAAGLAVSAPVAHGGNPLDRAGLSVERL